MNRALKEADIDMEEMDNLIDVLFGMEYGANPTGAAYLVKAQIKAHLRDYLSRYRIPLIKEKTVKIIGVEELIEATLNAYKLKGRLDVVEKRDDRICIVDYKSGSHTKSLKINFDKLDAHSRDSWDEAIGSLQLPFYLILYSQRHGIKIEDLRGMFLLLGRSLIKKEIELALFDTDDETAQFDRLRTVIFGLLDEIADLTVPFAATSDRKNSCPRCDFQYICGTQWVTG